MPDRRDILDLAGRRVAPTSYRGRTAPAGRTAPQGQPPPTDPVLIARQAIELLLRLMDALPTLAPIIQEFLDKLSRASAAAARRPVARRPGAPGGRGETAPTETVATPGGAGAETQGLAPAGVEVEAPPPA